MNSQHETRVSMNKHTDMHFAPWKKPKLIGLFSVGLVLQISKSLNFIARLDSLAKQILSLRFAMLMNKDGLAVFPYEYIIWNLEAC